MPRSRAKRSLLALIIAASLTYPFVVFLTIGHVPPGALGAGMGAIILTRLILGRNAGGQGIFDIAWVAAGIGLLALLLYDPALAVRAYPVLVSGGLALAFALTLRHPPPMIERFARLRHPDMSPIAIAYVRSVTKVWLAFFLVNGAIAGWTALWGSLAQWTLYNGLVSYLLMGALFAGELVVRHFVRRAERLAR